MNQLCAKFHLAILSFERFDTYFKRYLILYIIEMLLTYLRRSHNLMDSYIDDGFYLMNIVIL